MAEYKTLGPTSTYAPLLEKPKYRRDEQGQFARPEGFTLKIAQKKTGLIKKAKNSSVKNLPKVQDGGVRAGPGRPKGSQNKTTAALKDLILGSLDELGGKEYLKKLAIENSSAYASLIGKVLPTTLAASTPDGGSAGMVFERVIVWPDGRREVEGTTPKALPAPDTSHELPRPTDPTDDTNEGAV